ncbi:MAG: type II toxin-antitoxin system Phd/YefM family antitoxin [Candidatus Omnitrophica bacterium]|nr:type II toxin-antitoxin system Phd/YefM family antitoxin [Candidatus Omnitrophota bacterium]MCA9432023.1 type II toxin-antitoxin system Phd/YefM family antitoxin [Candidatus Omnitrophota bacterium]
MSITNIHEAKTHLSKLIERVSQGEEIVIGKAGRPVAKLVPYTSEPGPRKLGLWKGKVRIADDFDELPTDIAEAFGMGKE